MTAYVSQVIFDAPLILLRDRTTSLWLTDTPTTDYEQVVQSDGKAKKVGVTISQPQTTPNGYRGVEVSGFEDGEVLSSAEVKYWAFLDDNEEELLYATTLRGPVYLYVEDSFKMDPFWLEIS